jgi:hypothetical protein
MPPLAMYCDRLKSLRHNSRNKTMVVRSLIQCCIQPGHSGLATCTSRVTHNMSVHWQTEDTLFIAAAAIKCQDIVSGGHTGHVT